VKRYTGARVFDLVWQVQANGDVSALRARGAKQRAVACFNVKFVPFMRTVHRLSAFVLSIVHPTIPLAEALESGVTFSDEAHRWKIAAMIRVIDRYARNAH